MPVGKRLVAICILLLLAVGLGFWLGSRRPNEDESMNALFQLQKRINVEWDCMSKGNTILHVTEVAGLWHIVYDGQPLGHISELYQTLALPEVAPRLRAITIGGDDTGFNGTRPWEIGPLVAGATFDNLEDAVFQQTRPGDHNQSIIGFYEEDGLLAKLLTKAPKLRRLVSPSAPNPTFFDGPVHPLEILEVDVGYEYHRFLRHLAETRRFPSLEILQYGDFYERYLGDWKGHRTPFADFVAVLESKSLPNLRASYFRYTDWSPEETKRIEELVSRNHSNRRSRWKRG